MANCVFATAMIRSLEKRLLTTEQFYNMIDSGSIDDICRTVQEAGYGSDAEPFRPDTYMSILAQRENNLFDETLKLGKDFKVLDVLNLVNDYHNIKVLLKAEALGIDRSDILLNTGTIPAARMAELVRDRDRSQLTENMLKAVLEASDAQARTNDPQWIDIICDKYWFADMERVAEESGNKFVQGYVKAKVDASNLKTYVRVRTMGEAWPFFSDMFIPGGTIEPTTYQRAYTEDLNQFGAHFKGTLIYEAALDGRIDLEKTGKFTLFEKLCDDAVMHYAKEGKYVSYGIEVVFAYFVAKQAEMTNIRIMMAGKLAGTDPEVIKERMRETYE